jgi:hypothetical protein
LSTWSKAQPVAFKATEEEKKESTPSRLPIDASKLDNKEMALIIKSFRQILKQRMGKTTSSTPRRFATGVVSLVTLLQNVLFLVKVIGTTTRKGRIRTRRGTTRRRAAMPTYVGNGTPMRPQLTPPPTRTLKTSPSTKASSSPTSGTSVSWLRMTKRRRYNVEPPPNTQHLVMMIALVIVKII